jgi:hypothetical protein
MKMKKVYIAKRIPKNPLSYFVLNIDSSMTVVQIKQSYIEKVFIDKKYIYNGPWILRPPVSDNEFSLNKLPTDLKPSHIWDMVRNKIESSDVVVGIISNKSYGTIAEVGYACNCKTIAVYVLPDKNVTEEDLQDLWFLFQIAKTTRHLWSDDDIKNIDEFSVFGISSLQQYEDFLDTIVPNFMKK